MFDIFFISYHEPNADENWQKLKTRFPFAVRIDNIKGIHQAHIESAKQSFTRMFWVVDGDADIVDYFNFDFKVEDWDTDCVHVWKSINPVNNLEYGYGGVKLLPKKLTINMDLTKSDMTTGISTKFKPIPEVSNITKFNTDPFNAWKSAFRECVKLSSKIIDRQEDLETEQRLSIWCTIGKEKNYGSFVLEGANSGKCYGEQNKNNKELLQKINDFEWLKDKFTEKYGSAKN